MVLPNSRAILSRIFGSDLDSAMLDIGQVVFSAFGACLGTASRATINCETFVENNSVKWVRFAKRIVLLPVPESFQSGL